MKWLDFPTSSSDWHINNESNPLCDLVVFENRGGKIIGYAKTTQLIKDLVHIHYNQDILRFENALNALDGNFQQYATNNLPAFHLSAKGQSLEDVGASMISNNLSETVVDLESKRYYLCLSKLFTIQ
ncbi:MAG: hypothetical protein R6V04_00200 [bacterium]